MCIFLKVTNKKNKVCHLSVCRSAVCMRRCSWSDIVLQAIVSLIGVRGEWCCVTLCFIILAKYRSFVLMKQYRQSARLLIAFHFTLSAWALQARAWCSCVCILWCLLSALCRVLELYLSVANKYTYNRDTYTCFLTASIITDDFINLCYDVVQ